MSMKGKEDEKLERKVFLKTGVEVSMEVVRKPLHLNREKGPMEYKKLFCCRIRGGRLRQNV